MIGILSAIKYPQILSKQNFFSQLSSDAEYKEKLIAGTTVAVILLNCSKDLLLCG